MALHFVTTSILSSDDGIDFGKEEQVESEQAKQVRKINERASTRPLYEQLAEMEAQKQAEFDANTKRMFENFAAPPKAIDNEEYEFLTAMATIKSKELEKREEEEKQLINEYLHKKSNNKSDPIINIAIPTKEKHPESTVPIITKRRKINNSKDNEGTNNSKTNDKIEETKRFDGDSHNQSSMSLFSGYGSDSE